MNGIIVIGYQGIGKSSVCNYNHQFIDFESNLFQINGDCIDDWHIIYCCQAVSLAKQGFVVLVSSHECVREELAKYEQTDFNIVTITPSYSLKCQWIEKLRKRYIDDPSDKNQAALANAENQYLKNIRDIASDPNFSHIFINSMDYDLRSILQRVHEMFITKIPYYTRNRTVYDRSDES